MCFSKVRQLILDHRYLNIRLLLDITHTTGRNLTITTRQYNNKLHDVVWTTIRSAGISDLEGEKEEDAGNNALFLP